MHTQITFSHSVQFTSFDTEKICNFILGNDKVKEGKDIYVHLNC